MDIKIALNFLNELSLNNHRDWFQKNKPAYETIKSELLEFLDSLIAQISTFDPVIIGVNSQDCLFRIYRDVRFSNNKLPYKTHIGAFISRSGRSGNNPGYYLHLEPSNSLIACGLYMPPPLVVKAVRDEIYFNAEEYLAILNNPEFKSLFPALDDDDRLIRPPKGYPSEWEHIDLLKYRSFTVPCPIPEHSLFKPELGDALISTFRTMHPFNRFLQRAVDAIGPQ